MGQLRRRRWSLACLLSATTIVTTIAMAGAAPARPAPPADDAPAAADARGPAYFVILDAPPDFNALLQKIRRPDVEVRPAAPERPPAGAAGGSPASVVESVRIRGQVRGDSALLAVELAIVTAADETTWVPIRLDGQRLIDAREGPRILDLRMTKAGDWQVGLTGRGTHRLAVDLRCPLVTRPARTSMTLDIPEAPSTSLELDFDRRHPDLIIGANEVFDQADRPDGQGTRLSAHLSPRPRVEVSWAVDAESGRSSPPLLTAQGDIALDIDAGQMRTRSSWVIRCVRGVTRTLVVRVDDRDEVTDLRLDDQEAGGGIERADGAGRLTIPLPEPLRPGAPERRLILRTRRSLVPGPGHRIRFDGFPILYAREQSGAIGVTQSADLWVAPATFTGLRRIIPTFLPRELAERPGTSLAFEFLDQHFSLSLDVEASPPLIRSRSRTAIRVEGDRARTESSVELQWVRGRPFEVGLALGPGLEVVSVGPPSVVEVWNLPRSPAPPGSAPARRRLTVRLAEAVRDQSRVTLQVEGFQRLPREGPVKLGLFAPEDATPLSASFAVVGDRGLSAELDEVPERAGGDDPAAFRAADTPAGRAGAPAVAAPVGRALDLEAAGNPQVLPLRIARLPRSVRQETVVAAEVSGTSVDLIQKTTLSVRNGVLATPVIRVPAAIDRGGRWKLRDPEVVDREDLGRDADGSRRYRLILGRPIADRATLEFHWRLPLDRPLVASSDRELEVDWIAVVDASDGPTRVELTPGPGIVLRDADPSWTRAAADVPSGSNRDAVAFSEAEGTAGRSHSFRFKAVALEPVAMPALLVPRLLIRSGPGPEETIQHRAWFWVESHGPAFPFELPEGARLVAARVDGRSAERVDLEGQRGASRRYRLRLPAEAASRPVLVGLDYRLPASSAGDGWLTPQLPADAPVLQTLWEMRLPWDRALLGAPSGWTDENEWYWGGNVWVRRPARDGAALDAWLLGDGAPASAIDELRGSEGDDAQHLLFSRSGGPPLVPPGGATEIGVRIVPRAWLVAACSGATLLLGFLAMFGRLRFRTTWAIAAGLGLLAGAWLQPSAAAQLAQSSVIGGALTILGVSIQHRLDRRRALAPRGREPGSGLGPPREESSLNRVPVVGSDDPTAIRARTPSTMDFVPSPLAQPAATDEARRSAFGRT